MKSTFARVYKETLWRIYARSVSFVSVLGFVIIVVLGGYDLLELASPKFTMASGLYEKYQTNETFTKFGALKQGLSDDEVTRERISNYEQLLRMERQDAKQSLVKIGLACLALLILNGFLFTTYDSSPPTPDNDRSR